MANILKKIKKAENMTKTEDCKNNQLEPVEINNILPEVKNSIDGFNIAKKSSTISPLRLRLGPVLWHLLWPSSSHKAFAWLRI